MSIKSYVGTKPKNATSSANKPAKTAAKWSTPNLGGGYSLKLLPEQALERFLILGTENGTYAFGGRRGELFKMQSQSLNKMLAEAPNTFFSTLQAVNNQKRYYKKDPMLYSLAVASSVPDIKTRTKALDLIPSVCTTGTDLFNFVEAVTHFRGWGRALTTAIGDWYSQKEWKDLVYQVLKYRQRDGWSVKDIFRVAHPKDWRAKHGNALADWVVNGNEARLLAEIATDGHFRSRQIEGFLEVQSWKQEDKSEDQKKRLINLIVGLKLTREMVPTWYLNDPMVQEALLQDMPLEAMLRNLATMTKSGCLNGTNDAVKLVCSRLENVETLKKVGIHPLKYYTAWKTYQSGRGFKGDSNWQPVSLVNGAIQSAFFASFDYAPSTGRNWRVSIDVSGSMSSGFETVPNSTYCEIAAVLALAFVKAEKYCDVYCFSNKLNHLDITKHDTLQSVVKKTAAYNVGTTNAGLPIEKAIKDATPELDFIHITDCDYNSGKHPFDLIKDYRKKVNFPDARLVSLGMQASVYGLAGYGGLVDPYSVDFVGFDPSFHKAVSSFCGSSVVNSSSEEES